jgi:hypothetical protein
LFPHLHRFKASEEGAATVSIPADHKLFLRHLRCRAVRELVEASDLSPPDRAASFRLRPEFKRLKADEAGYFPLDLRTSFRPL